MCRLRPRCERAGDGYRGLLQHRRPDVEIDPARCRRQVRGGGKTLAKKDVALQAISYGNVYVARIAFGANPQQALQALREAEAYPGPSLIIAYSHCIAHGIDMEFGLTQQNAPWPPVTGR